MSDPKKAIEDILARAKQPRDRTAEVLIADALAQEEKLDRAEIAPVYALCAVARDLEELHDEIATTNQLLGEIAKSLGEIVRSLAQK